jgi:hypothetical protein
VFKMGKRLTILSCFGLALVALALPAGAGTIVVDEARSTHSASTYATGAIPLVFEEDSDDAVGGLGAPVSAMALVDLFAGAEYLAYALASA